MVNMAVAEKTLDYLTRNPELHDQSGWVYTATVDDPSATEETCGTTGCIAGWASIEYFDLKPIVTTDRYDSRYRTFRYEPPAGHDWETAGIKALGIHRQLAGRLFYMSSEDGATQALADLIAGVSEEEIVIRIRSGYYSDSDEGTE